MQIEILREVRCYFIVYNQNWLSIWASKILKSFYLERLPRFSILCKSHTQVQSFNYKRIRLFITFIEPNNVHVCLWGFASKAPLCEKKLIDVLSAFGFGLILSALSSTTASPPFQTTPPHLKHTRSNCCFPKVCVFILKRTITWK